MAFVRQWLRRERLKLVRLVGVGNEARLHLQVGRSEAQAWRARRQSRGCGRFFKRGSASSPRIEGKGAFPSPLPRLPLSSSGASVLSATRAVPITSACSSARRALPRLPLSSSGASVLSAARAAPIASACPSARRVPVHAQARGCAVGSSGHATQDGASVYETILPGRVSADPFARSISRPVCLSSTAPGVPVFTHICSVFRGRRQFWRARPSSGSGVDMLDASRSVLDERRVCLASGSGEGRSARGADRSQSGG